MLLNKFKSLGAILFTLLLSSSLWAQNDAKILVVTRVHGNLKGDFTMDQWKAHEKEYFDKVTQKNDFIVGATVLTHYYTSDNSEVLFAQTFRNWSDIEKSEAKNDELAKAAWPDEASRRAFFSMRNSFYTAEHSDEIRQILPNTKPLGAETAPQVYYVRTSLRVYPPDAKPGEFTELMNEYNQNVTLKNSLVKGYYPSAHLWGSNGREYVESFVFASLSDMEKALDMNDQLMKAHWPDEAKRKEFGARVGKYFENWHGDALYHNVPELRKIPAAK
jgi:hypothetical protein